MNKMIVNCFQRNKLQLAIGRVSFLIESKLLANGFLVCRITFLTTLYCNILSYYISLYIRLSVF